MTNQFDSDDGEHEDQEDSEEFLSSTRGVNLQRLKRGAEWLRQVCSEDGKAYPAAGVLHAFVVQGIIGEVYPRFSDVVNHRFSPSYYLTCLLERIRNCDTLDIDVKWTKATHVVSVKPLKKYKMDRVQYRFTYGLHSVVVDTRYVAVLPRGRGGPPETIEERVDRLEGMILRLLPKE